MTITASELKSNLGKYIELAEHEDIYVTKNGKNRIKISGVNSRPLAALDSVFVGMDKDINIDDLKWERLKNV